MSLTASPILPGSFTFTDAFEFSVGSPQKPSSRLFIPLDGTESSDSPVAPPPVQNRAMKKTTTVTQGLHQLPMQQPTSKRVPAPAIPIQKKTSPKAARVDDLASTYMPAPFRDLHAPGAMSYHPRTDRPHSEPTFASPREAPRHRAFSWSEEYHKKLEEEECDLFIMEEDYEALAKAQEMDRKASSTQP